MKIKAARHIAGSLCMAFAFSVLPEQAQARTAGAALSGLSPSAAMAEAAQSSARAATPKKRAARAPAKKPAPYSPPSSYLLIDAASGDVLLADRPDEARQAASMTKVVTVMKLFDALDSGQLSLNSRLPVSRNAAGITEGALGLRAGSSITVEDAILALAVKSANDVAVVVAEALAGTEAQFAKEMTAKVRALGAAQTTFSNASGLPPGRKTPPGQNITTARDMVRIYRALLTDYPAYHHYLGAKEFTYGAATYKNHNNLLVGNRNRGIKADDRVKNGKTGYIRASGFNLVLMAEDNGRVVIAVIFGGKTQQARDNAMVLLLDDAFEILEIRKNPAPASLPAPQPVP